MKLTLPVPIRKVQVGPAAYTFEHELREVAVRFLTRYRADRNGRRWHYHAHFDHPEAHPEAPRVGRDNLLSAWVRRADHRGWQPPAFPGGCTVVEIDHA